MQTPQSGTDDGRVEGNNSDSGELPELTSPLRRRFIWTAVTATTVAAASGSLLWWRGSRPNYRTAVGEMGYVELPDGSMAILNTASEMEAAFTRKIRRIRVLRGEVLFDVTSDPRRLFVIEVDGCRVETSGSNSEAPRLGESRAGWLVDYARDIATPLTRRTSHTLFATRGTTFCVRQGLPAGVEVIVLEGFVDVRQPGTTGHSATHIGPRMILIPRDGRQLRISIIGTSSALEGKIAWLQRRLTFTNQTLREAAEEFNRYNHVRIVFEGSAGAQHIVGAFDIDSPLDFAHVVERVSGIRPEISDTAITFRE